jgi:hypothetical protein
MPHSRLDPARLQGEALQRWYVRSPEDVEEARQAAHAQRYGAFFGGPPRPQIDPGFSRDLDPSVSNVDPGFNRGPDEFIPWPNKQIDPGFSAEADRWFGPTYSTRRFVDRGLAGPGDGGDFIEIGTYARHRPAWERREGQPWPKTADGRNSHVSHIKALADGGSDTLDNIEPEHPDEHIRRHKDNGDFARWAKRRGGVKMNPPKGGPIVRGLGLLGIIPNITGILSGRIRTDTPIHFWYDMAGYPSPDDLPPVPDVI